MSYLTASNLTEVLAALKAARGAARVVAGATDLFLQEFPTELIDLAGLSEINQIEEANGVLSIGAAVTHTEISHSPQVVFGATALSEACGQIGSPQIRNIGTIGGNVVNAAPAADAAVALVALGARAVLVDLEGEIREEAVEDLYADYNCSVINSCYEVMLKLIFKPCDKNEGTAFIRFASRKALSLPIVNAAARVRVVDNRLQEVCLVAAPLKPAPTRLYQTEEMLLGLKLVEDTRTRIEASASAEAAVRGSLLRCSEQYRRHLVGILAGRVVNRAVERALGREEGENR